MKPLFTLWRITTVTEKLILAFSAILTISAIINIFIVQQ